MRIFLRIVAAILLLAVVLAAASALSNLWLPSESSVVRHLSEADKARVAETYHLRSELGGQVWSGWETAEIPVILHNESYAFLLRYPGEPPKGWMKVPAYQEQGGAWTRVPDDSFLGEPYYRQPLPSKDITPENFTVRVGDQWAATYFTKEYAEIAFYDGFREEMPAFLRPLLPYRLIWHLLMGSSDKYMNGLNHESFHAFQGINAPKRMTAAERVASMEADYPSENKALQAAWEAELDILFRAVNADSDRQAAELARQFLAQRRERRTIQAISSEHIDYERKREWLEGAAKYSELSLGLAAYRANAYQPVPEIEDVPDFGAYENQDSYWNQQINEIRRQSNQPGESRFYFSGMAQAILLDRLQPGWKENYWHENIWLEDMFVIDDEFTGGDISINAVNISADQVRIHGEADLAGEVCLKTELWADGESLSWWPAEECASLHQGAWEFVVDLAPQNMLQPGVQYQARAFREGEPERISVFPFDLDGPPMSEP